MGVDMTLKTHGEAVTLTVGDGENTVTLEKRPEQTARSPLTKETARRNLSKTGGTPFYLREAQIDLPEGVLLAGSQISDMRREALEQLLTLRRCDRGIACIGVAFGRGAVEKPTAGLEGTGIEGGCRRECGYGGYGTCSGVGGTWRCSPEHNQHRFSSVL